MVRNNFSASRRKGHAGRVCSPRLCRANRFHFGVRVEGFIVTERDCAGRASRSKLDRRDL